MLEQLWTRIHTTYLWFTSNHQEPSSDKPLTRDDLANKNLDPLQEQFQALYPQSTTRLIGQEWLNDEPVNVFMKSLASTSHGKVELMDSQLAKSVKNLQDPNQWKGLKNRLAQADLILWPICESNHWYLILLEKTHQKAKVYMLDGLNDKSHKTIKQTYAMPLVKQQCPTLRGRQIQYSSLKVPHQSNSYDCGAVICYWAKQFLEEIIKNKKLPEINQNKQIDYNAFREEMARSLIDFSASKEKSSSIDKNEKRKGPEAEDEIIKSPSVGSSRKRARRTKG